MTKIGTYIANKFFSKYVGKDKYGNKYYISSRKNAVGKNKRTVIYQGISEPSKVPPLWHAWLHYMIDEIPEDSEADEPYEWQLDKAPNMTGTRKAYFPQGHISSVAKRKKVSADYESWKPNE